MCRWATSISQTKDDKERLSQAPPFDNDEKSEHKGCLPEKHLTPLLVDINKADL